VEVVGIRPSFKALFVLGFFFKINQGPRKPSIKVIYNDFFKHRPGEAIGGARDDRDRL
jgi:hypothetical protein